MSEPVAAAADVPGRLWCGTCQWSNVKPDDWTCRGCGEYTSLRLTFDDLEELRETDRLALEAERARADRYRAALEDALSAATILKRGMGGHNHWDPTGRRGVGCHTCILQREAIERAAPLLDAARTALEQDRG